ncbi:MAG: DNA recombination protein RmuC [Paludibacteraceae bacterium]
MTNALFFIIGFAVACVVAALLCWLWIRKIQQQNTDRLQQAQENANTEKNLLRSQVESEYAARLARTEGDRDNALQQLETQKQAYESQLSAQKAEAANLLETTKTEHEQQLASVREDFQKRLEQTKADANEQTKHLLSEKDKAFANQEQRFKETTEKLVAQMKTATEEMLKQRQEELGKANTEHVGKLLTPIQQEMENVRKLMADTRSANEKSTSSLEGALREMQKQTQQISQEATNLADALKNRGKVHGDWGEQVLADILSNSGLREGIEYNCQESFKGDKGNELRPDVVVTCADGKRIIIDSKVSLTAYTDALGADNEEERTAAVRKNYESVKKHVKELADKQYPKYVPDSMNYVLLFIPNEGAYVMAMNYDHSIAQEAFRTGVIIVNPTNLMLTLNLVVQTWQNTRQEDNCKKILDAANGMYDKVLGLVDTCNTLGSQLDTAQSTYRRAMTQLSEGQGNVLRRVMGLKDIGITSTKRLRTRKAATTDNLPETTADALPESDAQE